MPRFSRVSTVFALFVLFVLVVGCSPLPIREGFAGLTGDAPVVVDDTTAVGETIDTPIALEIPAQPITINAAPVADVVDGFENRLTDLYANVSPAVVHIFNYQGNFPQGTGTGFLYDALGHVVTNNHVIENGERYEVVFPNGERVAASLVGADVDSDLAVIKLERIPEGVTPLPLGNSRDVEVGQFVVAIGNPFGQESSMTLGIVSGLGRTLRSQRVTEGGGQYSLPAVIQTDAPINPGNSGGPLLNLAGEVVGVNAAIRSETGANTGVGFSIPVNAVHRVVPSLIAEGRYTYPYLGVSVNDSIDLAQQEALGLTQTNGAYVTTVAPDSPAGQAGVVGANGLGPGGDLIVAIDGEPVNGFNDLISYLVFETEVGQTITLTIIRDDETIQLPVTLGARP
jgi:2-alkenal reductase